MQRQQSPHSPFWNVWRTRDHVALARDHEPGVSGARTLFRFTCRACRHQKAERPFDMTLVCPAHRFASDRPILSRFFFVKPARGRVRVGRRPIRVPSPCRRPIGRDVRMAAGEGRRPSSRRGFLASQTAQRAGRQDDRLSWSRASALHIS